MEPLDAIPALLFGPPFALGLWAMRRLPRRANIALALGVLAALVGGELALRGLGLAHPARAEWLEPQLATDGTTPAYAAGGELVYRYPTNPRGYFDANGEVRGTINALGYRGPLRPRERTPGVARIALLGDSFALGIGVRDEDTLSALLERRLEGVEVLDFGVSSADTVDEVRYLTGYVSEFAPDLALIVFFPNDAERAPTMEYLTRPRALPELRKRSFLLHAAVSLLERVLSRGAMRRHYLEGYEPTSPGWLRAREALRGARDHCARAGMRLAVAVHPILVDLDDSPFAPIHAAVLDFCASEGIPAVDLAPALAGERDRDLWVHPNDRHSNERCNRLTAARLAEFVRERDLLAR